MVRIRFRDAGRFISHPSHCMQQQRGDQFGKFEKQEWIQASVPVVASTQCTLEAVITKVASMADGINMPLASTQCDHTGMVLAPVRESTRSGMMSCGVRGHEIG